MNSIVEMVNIFNWNNFTTWGLIVYFWWLGLGLVQPNNCGKVHLDMEVAKPGGLSIGRARRLSTVQFRKQYKFIQRKIADRYSQFYWFLLRSLVWLPEGWNASNCNLMALFIEKKQLLLSTLNEGSIRLYFDELWIIHSLHRLRYFIQGQYLML